MSEVSAPVQSEGASAPAPEPVVNQTLTTQPEATVSEVSAESVPPAQETAAPEAPKSIVGDLMDDGTKETPEGDYNYDYDDIQLENGLVGSDGDKTIANNIAKELGLTREQARKLYQRGGDIVRSVQQNEHNAMIEQWNQQIQSDPEVGGANLQQSIANFKAAMRAFGSPELRQVLTKYPIYQSPAFFKFFAKAGQAISSDNNLTQTTSAAPRKLSEREEFLRQFPNSEYLLDDNFRN